MISQIFNKDVAIVLTIFAISPGSRHLRGDLKEKTKLNNVNLDNVINLLLNIGLIKKEKRLFSLNLEKDSTKGVIKIISNDYKKRELPLAVYFSILSLVDYLSRLKVIDVYLFGSYSKLIFKEDSDIDIAIVSNSIDKKGINNFVKKVESRYGKKIEIHCFTKGFYKNKKDPLVKDILKNGIKLI